MAEGSYRFDLPEILERVDLQSLFDEFGIASAGSGYRRRFSCPDPGHGDAHPSVTVGRKPNGYGESFKCWSGDHRGDAVDLVKLRNPGYSDREAIEWLAGFAGVGENERGRRPPRAAPTRAARAEFVPFAQRGRMYVQRCHAMLGGDVGVRQRKWLADRGISVETARANLVGADPGFVHMRRNRGLPAGTSPGVTFPALGPDGEVTYVQLRSLPEELVDPVELSVWHAERGWVKYDNPASKVGSNPRVSFQVCPDGVSRAVGALVVTEGIPDGLIAAQSGFRAVSILGSQAPDGRAVALVANVAVSESLDVVIAVDADAGGSHARQLLRQELTKAGIDPVDVALPGGLDMNDWSLLDSRWADNLEEQIVAACGVELPAAEVATGLLAGGVDDDVAVFARAFIADHLYGLAGPVADDVHAESWLGPTDVSAALAGWGRDRVASAVAVLGEFGADVAGVDARISDDALSGTWLSDAYSDVVDVVESSLRRSPLLVDIGERSL